MAVNEISEGISHPIPNDNMMEERDSDYESAENNSEEKEEEDVNRYLPLYRAALKGDWECAKTFLAIHPEAVSAEITPEYETALHVAVGTGHALWFVEELVDLMPPESLALMDINGDTALAYAAMVNNIKAAEIMVNKNPNLPQFRNFLGQTPLHRAAEYGKKEIACYLLSVTGDRHPSPYANQVGADLLNRLILAEFYDLALDLIRTYPKLAIGFATNDDTALGTLAQKPSVFASGTKLSFWQQLIYSCIPVEHLHHSGHFIIRKGDMENPIESCKSSEQMLSRFQGIHTNSVCLHLNSVLWNIIKRLVPSIKQIHDKKMMHLQSLALVTCICEEALALSSAEALELLRVPMLRATILGIREFVTEIIQFFPYSIWFKDDSQRTIFHYAILVRQEKIFNLIYQMSSQKHFVPGFIDNSNNNILHLAGNLAPYHQLNSVSGAALQMQRELQWYKEVEKLVRPSFKEMKNSKGKTPRMVFTDEHKELVKEGEKWMKDTASSCMVLATLIATVVFAAAFTVPGGNDSNQGIPIFLRERSFMVFAVSDALALFSSIASVLMFLSILTSRYAEEDFLESLPKRLIIGLITLFFSIASMMIAFSATMFIVLGRRVAWVAIPVALLACMPVTLFALLQFPLIVKIVQATYMPRIFYQQSKEKIY